MQAEGAGPPVYESLYRRSAFALVALPSILIAVAAIFVAAFRFAPDRRTLLLVIVVVAGAMVAAILTMLFAVLRTHRWTIEPEGIRIEERPRVPLTGFRRRTVLRFKDVVGIQRVQSGSDSLIEIAARDGHRFRLAQAYVPPAEGPAPSLEAFLTALTAAMQRAGHSPAAVGEGLSFFNQPAGLAAQVVLFVLTLAIAIAAMWGMWITPSSRARAGWVVAILVLLPVGAGWLFLRSLKRRRAVLARGQAR